MRKLILMAILALPCTAFAANTTVTATVTDADGTTWVYGKVSAKLILPPGTQSATSGGVPVPTTAAENLDSNGAFSLSLADTSTLDQPGLLWQVTVCPNTSVYALATCFTYPKTAITGASYSMTLAFTGVPAPRLPAGEYSFAYTDAEILSPLITGSTYFNVGNTAGMRLWDGARWQGGSGGGGGGGVPSVNGITGAVTIDGDMGIQADTFGSTITLTGQPFVASGASHAAGMVPDPGDTAGTYRALFEDATFKAVLVPNVSLTSGYVPKANGSYSLTDSSIVDNGTTVQTALPLTAATVSTGSGATACSTASGCLAMTETVTHGVPTASQDYIRADLTTHQLVISLNGGAETPIGSGGSGVASINGSTGAFTFTGSGVSCSTTTCTFSGTGSGVTSVALALPSFITVSGSPVTSSGTLTGTLANQTAHTLFGNFTGSSAAPTFTALGTGIDTWLVTPSSANLAAAVTDETGSGLLVFGTSPTLVTPALGVPSALTLTNATGLPTAGLVNSAVTLAKIQNAAASSKLLGSGASGSGAAYVELTLGTNLSMSGTTLNATGGGGLTDCTNNVGTDFTCTVPVKAPSFVGTGTTPSSLSLPAGTGSIPALASNSAGFSAPTTGGTAYVVKFPATITAGIPHFAAPGTTDGVNTSVMTSSGIAIADLTATGTPSSSTFLRGDNTWSSPTVASGTATLGTSSISSGACATVVTVSATGVATTDVIGFVPNADLSAVTGYAPVTTGGLYILPYPTTNNVNFKVCNPTNSSITPGAVTLNWRVGR